MNLYGQINPVFKQNVSDEVKRVVLFNPTELYKSISIDNRNRYQKISMDSWPVIEKYCNCGCGAKLTGRQKRWSNPDHVLIPLNIIEIIRGDSDVIRRMMLSYLDENCAICGKSGYLQEKITEVKLPNGRTYHKIWSQNGIHVDHILPVDKGGGGCWLGNYQFLCQYVTCKKAKK